ncbi:Scr1 family TA system antitoxin-like transcriptional regulator [Nocardia abscessus]|uniref:Scr1 family TA system antitoxin-like transcriptional regulator n=1 Tax=Nocardia abscessus TaxID=120957 RepID=UPI002454E121|nr:Scr1 family TA system antitoxin-like transcriptional regulator [Nocardia abscessus]
MVDLLGRAPDRCRWCRSRGGGRGDVGVAVGPFIILEFGVDAEGQPIEPPVVYVENFAGDLYLEKPGVVRRYHQAYDSIRHQHWTRWPAGACSGRWRRSMRDDRSGRCRVVQE